jgi:hypothetical protein
VEDDVAFCEHRRLSSWESDRLLSHFRHADINHRATSDDKWLVLIGISRNATNPSHGCVSGGTQKVCHCSPSLHADVVCSLTFLPARDQAEHEARYARHCELLFLIFRLSMMSDYFSTREIDHLQWLVR